MWVPYLQWQPAPWCRRPQRWSCRCVRTGSPRRTCRPQTRSSQTLQCGWGVKKKARKKWFTKNRGVSVSYPAFNYSSWLDGIFFVTKGTGTKIELQISETFACAKDSNVVYFFKEKGPYTVANKFFPTTWETDLQNIASFGSRKEWINFKKIVCTKILETKFYSM